MDRGHAVRADPMKRWAIERENCLEFFSAVEHPLPYCKCKNGHFHVPAYSRVLIRNTRKRCFRWKNGQPGLLNFVSPLVLSMPLVSIVTDDLAVLHDGAECGCGIEHAVLYAARPRRAWNRSEPAPRTPQRSVGG